MRTRTFCQLGLLAAVLALAAERAAGQLFENLRHNLEAFGDRLDSGHPDVPAAFLSEGPKGVAAGDVDGDGVADIVSSNLDGTVTLFLRRPGVGKFDPPVHLQTGMQSLRGIILQDFNTDRRADIAAAAPFDGQMVIFVNAGGGSFYPPLLVPAWEGARNLAAGFFAGISVPEIALAGPGLGLRQYRRGPGFFEPAADLAELNSGGWEFPSPRPVYSLKTYRLPGAPRDELVVTHALSDAAWILAAGPAGRLEVQGEFSKIGGVYSLDVGPVTTPRASRLPDLVTACRNTGIVEVRRGNDAPSRFDEEVHQTLHIPGGPRSVRLVDLDRNGWNDLVVVVRNFDLVLTFRNEGGHLVAASEMPVGRSPREVAVADFDLDGWPDLAVINRESSDISVLSGHPRQVGFSALDQFYLVDGEVVGLEVIDVNGDGRDDVIQLHRASGDLSVRLAGPEGHLQAPAFYPMGPAPTALATADVDGDDRPDMVTANLGISGVENGSISARLGDGNGGFGPELRSGLPPGLPGRLFALELADFDGDGKVDAAAVFLDSRLGLLKGDGSGSFVLARVHAFAYAARGLAAGDFDDDGDADLAGASFTGDVVVVENPGDLLSSPNPARRFYPSPAPEKFRTKALKAADLNGDGDLDLVVGTGKGVMVYEGADGTGGTRFRLAAETLTSTDFTVDSIALADFDGVGGLDMAVACHACSSLTMLTQSAAGDFLLAVDPVDVPAAKLVAAGYLDGDAHPDLVGSGPSLWTALSSLEAEKSEPPVKEGERQRIPDRLVVNEILASHRGGDTDWVELYNNSDAAIDLAGWKIILEVPGKEWSPWTHEFPAGEDSVVEPRRRKLVVFEDPADTPYDVGVNLPQEGGKLVIEDPQGQTVNEVRYPAQFEDVSYSRFQDALLAFVFNPYPSPELPNVHNGTVDPLVKLENFDSQDVRPGKPVPFLARARDDVGIVSVSLLYQRIDVRDEPHRIVLHDDGRHGDGGAQDGFFGGAIEPGFPDGAELVICLEVVDANDNVVRIPDTAGPAGAETIGEAYSFVVGEIESPLEISELVARNADGLEVRGTTPDWVAVRNCSQDPAPLDGVFLAENFPATSDWFQFLPGLILAPGDEILVFCDGQDNPGVPFHAPFRLSGREGGRLVLIGTGRSGAHARVDSVEYGVQEQDRAWARVGCGGFWGEADPTPWDGTPLYALGDVDSSGHLSVTDVVAILGYIFRGRAVACPGAVDVNADGVVDVSDAIYLLLYLFNGAPSRGWGEC